MYVICNTVIAIFESILCMSLLSFTNQPTGLPCVPWSNSGTLSHTAALWGMQLPGDDSCEASQYSSLFTGTYCKSNLISVIHVGINFTLYGKNYKLAERYSHCKCRQGRGWAHAMWAVMTFGLGYFVPVAMDTNHFCPQCGKHVAVSKLM